MGREKDIDLGGGAVARPGRRRKHLKVLHTLYESNTRDVPKTLRKIARQLEKGEIAQANEAALVLDCRDGTYQVHGFGTHYSSVNDTFTLLNMGADRVKDALKEVKELQAEGYEKPPKEPA